VSFARRCARPRWRELATAVSSAELARSLSSITSAFVAIALLSAAGFSAPTAIGAIIGSGNYAIVSYLSDAAPVCYVCLAVPGTRQFDSARVESGLDLPGTASRPLFVFLTEGG
jgi:hypothetical protein